MRPGSRGIRMHAGREDLKKVCHCRARAFVESPPANLWEETSWLIESQQVEEIAYEGALHITPKDQHFNKDVGLELPDCWVSTIRTTMLIITCLICFSACAYNI